MGLLNKEILILDDSPEMRMVLRKILEGAGCVVKDAERISDAVEIMTIRRPHGIVLDMQLHGEETGLQFLKFCKSQEVYSSIPIIALSSFSKESLITKALGLGVNDYLVKPLNSAFLLQKLRKAFMNFDEDENSRVIKYKYESCPVIKTTFPCRLASINEVSCMVQSPIKIIEDEKLNIISGFLDSLGFDSVSYEAKVGSKYIAEGVYETKVVFLGVTESAMIKIRKM